jgi:hypothetical protein
MTRVIAWLIVLLAAAPRSALACPVCFGQNDSPMAAGTNMGIFFMLALVAIMFAAFAGFFVHLMRRARLAASDRDRAGAPHAQPQEGTA